MKKIFRVLAVVAGKCCATAAWAMFSGAAAIGFLGLSCVSCASDPSGDDGFSENYPVVFAHRGCWLGDVQSPGKVEEYYVPENSLDGVRMAARMGYPTVEIDVHWTLDSVLVCMHDGTINRTMRNAADQSEIGEPVAVAMTSFEELRTKYLLASVEPSMRGQIPTLEEMLRECASCGIKPILHCDIAEGYDMAVSILGDSFIAFGSAYATFAHVREISPCLILFDAKRTLSDRGLEFSAENVNAILAEFGGEVGTSSMSYEVTDPDMIAGLHAAGHPVQSSIFPRPHEACAVRNGADILLSDFCWRPRKGQQPAERKVVTAGVAGGAAGSVGGGEETAVAEFAESELGALTLEIVGHGSCTLTVEERAFTGAVETYTYKFGSAGASAVAPTSVLADAPGVVVERLSYRFWRNAVTVRLTVAPGSEFTLTASRYEL